jgi:fumarate reductase flavoprotein subunit
MSAGQGKHDILVVGGGLAGLVAASRAAELGAVVLLVEKGGFMGEGNTLTTSGAYYTAGIGYGSSPDELNNRVMTRGAAFPELARAWADNCRRGLEWLESAGVQVDRTGGDTPRLEVKSAVSAAPVYKVDVGPNIVKKLRAFFDSHQGVSASNTTVVKLMTHKGGVVGVEAVDSAGKRVKLSAGATVLATGGFQADRELLRKNVGRRADGCKLMGSATATGAGLKMALAVKAKVVNLQYLNAHMVSARAFTDDRFWPYPTLETLIEDGMVVDRTGKRFRDEGWGDLALANTVARWEEVGEACLIFDEQAWERSKMDTQSVVPANPWLMEKGGDIYKADSPAELAAKLGINGKALEAEVENFNTAAKRRKLGELPVQRINNPGPLKPPYYGMKVVPGIISTMGGPLINRRASVLDRHGKAIPGLYAAGDVVGGLMGGPNGGYVGGISQATVTGLLAAEYAYKYATLS